jgi:hypothetical protein
MSHTFDSDATRIRGKSFEIIGIRGEDSTVGFRHRDNQRVHHRPAPSVSAQERSAPGQSLSNALDEIASLEKPVFRSVSTGVPLQALDQHH